MMNRGFKGLEQFDCINMYMYIFVTKCGYTKNVILVQTKTIWAEEAIWNWTGDRY